MPYPPFGETSGQATFDSYSGFKVRAKGSLGFLGAHDALLDFRGLGFVDDLPVIESDGFAVFFQRISFPDADRFLVGRVVRIADHGRRTGVFGVALGFADSSNLEDLFENLEKSFQTTWQSYQDHQNGETGTVAVSGPQDPGAVPDKVQPKAQESYHTDGGLSPDDVLTLIERLFTEPEIGRIFLFDQPLHGSQALTPELAGQMVQDARAVRAASAVARAERDATARRTEDHQVHLVDLVQTLQTTVGLIEDRVREQAGGRGRVEGPAMTGAELGQSLRTAARRLTDLENRLGKRPVTAAASLSRGLGSFDLPQPPQTGWRAVLGKLFMVRGLVAIGLLLGAILIIAAIALWQRTSANDLSGAAQATAVEQPGDPVKSPALSTTPERTGITTEPARLATPCGNVEAVAEVFQTDCDLMR